MKKYNLFFLIILGIVLLIGGAVTLIASIFKLPNASISNMGNVVESLNNNYDLVMIENKLYYNYEKNEFCNGLIEISEEGSTRIASDGNTILQLDHWTHPIRSYNNKLCTTGCYDEERIIKVYNSETRTFTADKYLNNIPEISIDFVQTDYGLIYTTYSDNNDVVKLAIYLNGNMDIIAHSYIGNFVVVGDDVYYSQSCSDNGEYTNKIKKYNLKSKRHTEICDVSKYRPLDFYVENNCIIFEAFQLVDWGVYKVDIDSPQKTETVYLGDDIASYSVFDSKVYISTETGIICANLDTNEKTVLCDKYAEECYIVDDKWVYFRGKKSSLWRVAQDGSIVEKVYG